VGLFVLVCVLEGVCVCVRVTVGVLDLDLVGVLV